jgi:hypothetical protein
MVTITSTLRDDERITPAIEVCERFMAERGVELTGISEQRAHYLIFAVVIEALAKLRDDAGLS